MKPPSPPDCAFLPYHVTQDPKWDNSTDKYARCVCRGATMFTMECEIEIPNDHVIDRAAVSQSRDRCGSSVYNAIDRLSSWKAGRKCILSHVSLVSRVWVVLEDMLTLLFYLGQCCQLAVHDGVACCALDHTGRFHEGHVWSIS